MNWIKLEHTFFLAYSENQGVIKFMKSESEGGKNEFKALASERNLQYMERNCY